MSITTPGRWARLALATSAIFAMFHALAARLGSLRGEAGLVVCAAVVIAVLAADRWLSGGVGPVVNALRMPRARGMAAAVGIAVVLLAVLPVTAWLGGGRLALDPGWPRASLGLFAQGGVAEELLFRGFLFAHVRAGRGFWRAAVLAMLPFVAVHGLLFATLPWPLAAASVGLAVVISFPLAYAFELAGNTVWAPAVIHAVIQGALKLVTIEDAAVDALAPSWFAASAVVPFAVFAVRRPADTATARRGAT